MNPYETPHQKANAMTQTAPAVQPAAKRTKKGAPGAGRKATFDSSYTDFLKSKRLIAKDAGFTVDRDVMADWPLYDFQKDIVVWAVKKGRASVFADVGLGKTRIQIAWAKLINQPTLIFAPLFVVHQTIEEAKVLGVDVRYAKSAADVDLTQTLFWITNYQRLDKFDPSVFNSVILDESSLLKAFSGITKKALVSLFKDTHYKLCCTATPAPNDLIEIGNHAEFLNVMSSRLMTASFFTHDSKEKIPGEGKYRLKKHSVEKFYEWFSSWAVALRKPSDLGYSDEHYQLPPLNITVHTVKTHYTPKNMLPGIGTQVVSATEANKVRRATIADRAEIVREIVNPSLEQWVIWTGLNDEDTALMPLIEGAVRVYGGTETDDQVEKFEAFKSQQAKVLITKDSIAGAGVNMQFAHNMFFFGIDYSWEGFYQAMGRMYRHGQVNPVNVHVVVSEQEQSIYDRIQVKGLEAKKMIHDLIEKSKTAMTQSLHQQDAEDSFTYETAEAQSKSGKWAMWKGDSCERMKEIVSDSIHMSIYSPPFGSTLFIYSNTERDLGNCTDNDQFMTQYRYIIDEMYRITMPGRLSCVHIQDIKLYGNRDGVRGIDPLSDQIIQEHLKAGWIFRSRVTIDKDPQLVATRNHDNDLLFVTGKRDSTDLAPQNTDYLLVFRKPGDNLIPVRPYEVNPLTGRQEMTEDEWIRNAHAVWYDIRETDTLNTAVAKASTDEKHLCALQLPLIERAVKMWSNPGETIFSPFGGIGSEPYIAVKTGRKGFAIELNPNYFRVACKNLQTAETKYSGRTLFDLLSESEV